jgi:hypothetical protein
VSAKLNESEIAGSVFSVLWDSHSDTQTGTGIDVSCYQ